MEKNAYAALDRFGLPHPAVMTLAEVMGKARPTAYYWLRSREYVDLPRMASGTYITQHWNGLSRLQASGGLYQVEPFVESLAGGCVVAGPERTTYLELVVGHLSGLLRNGWCSLRMLAVGSEIKTAAAPQLEMLRQTPPTIEVLSLDAVQVPRLEDPARVALGLRSNMPNRHLLEFIVDLEGRVLFVDVKEYEWHMCLEPLFSASNSTSIFKRAGAHTTITYHGSFDLKNLPTTPQNTCVSIDGHALLSHFITYSLRQGLAEIVR